jgi:predicted O-methyltransferase YrrM
MSVKGIERIRGLITQAQGEALAELASTIDPPYVIVELGSYMGKSTAYLASKARVPVHAVDLWTIGTQREDWRGRCSRGSTQRAFIANLVRLGLWRKVRMHRADSVAEGQAWDGPRIGLLYHDADHSEAGVTADLEAWAPHLAPGAIVAIDDYWPMYPGTIAAADAFVLSRQVRRRELIDGRMLVLYL